MGAAAHVGGWFLAPPPSLVKFRAWVCKTACPLECEKNSRIRILRFQRRARPSVLFPARGPQQPPRSHRGDHRCLRRRAGSVCPIPYQEAAAGPRSHRRDRRCLRRRAGSVCPPPCQEAAAGPRSHQGDRKGLRRRAGLPVLSPARGPQQAPGAARETAGTSAAGPVTFNARRDYELLEQVVSTYGR